MYLMRMLAESLNEAVTVALDRADLSEGQRKELKYEIVDETNRLFMASFEKYQQRVTEDRARGISALDPLLLENEDNS